MRKNRTRLYTIGSVSTMFSIHPQTLRLYEKEGLIKPKRSQGKTRYYTDEDLERLELILTLSREFGVNLAGIDIILRMKEQMEDLEAQFQKLVDFIQREISEAYHKDENIKSIVLSKRKDIFAVLRKGYRLQNSPPQEDSGE
ncbi:MAG: helix-turn-helix transcriptional regulator [Aquificaceae bacterium]|nr:helix-turn-helix transcriptional regulator [Aquificaceae bacterium]MDW8095913.1 helix-turn-helix transcriptional regulator [Aquificaceae bacterium]